MYNIPFHVTDWEKIEPTLHQGETGHALWRTWSNDGLRIRMVEYSKNYKADHWCEKGHLLFVLEGEMITALRDGSKFQMKAGTSYHVSDDLSSHQSYTVDGAKLLIIDGDFLSGLTQNNQRHRERSVAIPVSEDEKGIASVVPPSQ